MDKIYLGGHRELLDWYRRRNQRYHTRPLHSSLDFFLLFISDRTDDRV